ncbi:MAG TPA: AAA family ATPase [Candidatus Saccharimonadales bacterium]|nr:AAA family ATPase [Candidatus Saccharimonadales bacterium]
MKENLFRALISDDQINILLIGPSATSKTLFMTTIQEKCNNVFYFDASNTTGAGLIEELYNNRRARLVIIDEIDKLRKNDMNSLLGLLNDGRIVKSLKQIRYDFKFENIKVFATSNSVVSLSKPVRSRFQEYHLNEYTDKECLNVVKFCLQNKLPEEINEMIEILLIDSNTKNVRTAIGLANLLKKNDSRDDVIRVFENWANHKVEGRIDYS